MRHLDLDRVAQAVEHDGGGEHLDHGRDFSLSWLKRIHFRAFYPNITTK